MKPLVYVETSVVSYLTARTSSNLVTAARQAWTSQWWEVAPQHWTIKVSELVLDEASKGDATAAKRRLDVIAGIEVLRVTKDAHELAQKIIKLGALPSSEIEDALHIATASLNEARYLLTWNFSHLAGPDAKLKLQDVLRKAKAHLTLLTTPEEMLESMK
jgi:hypothetical protein